MPSAQLDLISVPLTINAGESFTATFRITNTGGTTLKADPFPQSVHISSMDPIDNQVWGQARARNANGDPVPVADIAPSEVIDLVCAFVAPQSTGLKSFSWQCVEEFVGRFGNIVTAQIQVGEGGGGGGGMEPSYISDPMPAPRADGSMQGARIFNTNAYNTNLGPRYGVWLNTTGREVRIRACRIWHGLLTGGVPADMHAEVRRFAKTAPHTNADYVNGDLLDANQTDRYENPSLGNTTLSPWFDPPFIVSPDEKLVLLHLANKLTAGVSDTHQTVHIWFEYGPAV